MTGANVQEPGRVRVGPFAVDDLDYAGVLARLVDLWQAPEEGPRRAYALHVGGLNNQADLNFRAAMAAADLVYADGISVALLARLAGARYVQRAPTTDLGHNLIDRLSRLEQTRGRYLRVTLIGGPPNLAAKAAKALSSRHQVEVASTTHGYHDDWSGPLRDALNSEPDLILVGMGVPQEQIFTEKHLLRGPHRLVVTCGGWFGFLVGEEHRAPRAISRVGLEWTWRLAQDPQRLAGRYARGIWNATRVGMTVISDRRRSTHSTSNRS